MHELSLAQDILQTAIQIAQQSACSHVSKLTIKVGTFSGVLSDSLLFGIEALAKDTICQSAVVEIIVVPLMIVCLDCKKESEIAPQVFLCPHCHSGNVQVLRGEELELVSMEAEK